MARLMRIGDMIPKDIGCYDVEFDDIEFKNKLVNILEIVSNKVLYNEENKLDHISYVCDWDEVDYNNFRAMFGRMAVENFSVFYDLFIYCLSLSKEDLEIELRKINDILDLHVFDCVKKTEIIEKDGLKYRRTTSKKHIFSTIDLPTLLINLYERARSFSNVLVDGYNNSIDEFKSLDSKITDISSMLESLKNNDIDLIEIIQNEYLGWIENISFNSIIYQDLLFMEIERLVEGNISSLRKELIHLEKAKEINFYKYRNDSINRRLEEKERMKKKRILFTRK